MAGKLSLPTWKHLLDAEMLVSEDLPGLPHVCSGLAARVQVPHLPVKCGLEPCAPEGLTPASWKAPLLQGHCGAGPDGLV